MKNEIIKTHPAIEPVSLDDVRSRLGVSQLSDTVRDDDIDFEIRTARELVEAHLHRPIINTTFLQQHDYFPCLFYARSELKSVVSLTYYDINNVLQTVDPSNYEVDIFNHKVLPKWGWYWPQTYQRHDAVTLEYIAGFGPTASDVPNPVKDAIIRTVENWEAYRQSESGFPIGSLPKNIAGMLDSYVDYRGFFG